MYLVYQHLPLVHSPYWQLLKLVRLSLQYVRFPQYINMIIINQKLMFTI